MKPKRQNWTSYHFKQVKVEDAIIFIPVVDDLENDQLVWHYERALSNEDYEYAGACWVEAELRGITHLLTT